MSPNNSTDKIIVPSEVPLIEDYVEYLKLNNITEYFDANFYMQINQQTMDNGWVFHISVIHFHFKELSKTLIPYLLGQNISFCIPKNIEIHKLLQAGLLGPENHAKIIYIFPNNYIDIELLAKDLIKITQNFNGPVIETDIHLENLVYAQYENFNSHISGNENTTNDLSERNSTDNRNISRLELSNRLSWPFKEFKYPRPRKLQLKLNNKYKVKTILKKDPKGKVILGYYKKCLLLSRKCVIKEGKALMAIDDLGRDIRDRLFWQNHIYKILKKSVNLPAVLDFFEENGNTYIVFEFLNAQSISDYIDNKLKGNFWDFIPEKEHLEIIELFINFLDQIHCIHKEGYIHRDLNIENILLDSNKKIWVIDFELSYNYVDDQPAPPFNTGTYGYMSPQQQSLNYSPSILDDIYSIGALLAVILLRIPITRFNTENPVKLKLQFSNFISDDKMVSLIVNCLSYEPEKRPCIQKIKESLTIYTQNYMHKNLQESKMIDIIELKKLIQRSLIGCTYYKMLNNDGIWTSPLNYNLKKQNISRVDRAIFYDIENGICGILYVIGIASKSNLDLSQLSKTINGNWDFVKSILADQSNNVSNGIFNGFPGIAITIKEMIDGKLLPYNDEIGYYLTECFKNVPQTNSLSNGIAGYGLALQKCKKYLPHSLFNLKMKHVITELINTQLPDGSWKEHLNNSEVMNGFFDGIAGISYFLLLYYQENYNPVILTHAIKTLDYLTKKIDKNKNWAISNVNNQAHNITTGGAYIITVYIKAYELTGDKSYKEIAENFLSTFPSKIIINNISLLNGITGLAEIYLFAWKVFKTDEWLQRADWIIAALTNSSFEAGNYSYWIQNDPTSPYAGLLHGNSGIILLLLHRLYGNELDFLF